MMPVSRFLKDARDTLSPYIQPGISTILSFTPIQNLQLGYQQFFNAISLWDAPLTKKILLLSAYTNLVDYLLPIILYRRAIDAIKVYSPFEATDCIIDAADNLIMFTIVLRLYTRRVWDNIFYTASLPRTIAADQSLKSFLPIKHQPPCGCDLKKIIHAGVSSPVYYTANHFYTTIPQILNNRQMLSDDNYFYASWAATLIAILIYGQGFNEYKVSPEDNCTRHRYGVFARNYFHSFGVGLGYYLCLQAAVQATYLTTGVKNYFVQDAFANLLMQFGVVSMLAYNDPLPGNINIWDIFSPLREVTSGIVTFLQRRLIPNMENKKSRDSVIARVYAALSSRTFRYGVELILSGGNYYPRLELLTWGAWRENKNITQDPRRVIFDNQAFKQFYDLFKDAIEIAIQKIKIAHYCSTWLAQPLLTAMRTPGGVMALIVDVLQIMKDECLDDIMKSNKLDELLLFYRQELKKNEVMVTIHPQKEEAKSGAAVVEEEKEEANASVPPPRRREQPKALSMNQAPHYFSAPPEYVEGVMMYSSSSPTLRDHFIKQAELDDQAEDPDGFTVVIGQNLKPVKTTSLVAQGLWGLRKVKNIVQQTAAGTLSRPHEANALVRYKNS
jgi:hypothetical protein